MSRCSSQSEGGRDAEENLNLREGVIPLKALIFTTEPPFDAFHLLRAGGGKLGYWGKILRHSGHGMAVSRNPRMNNALSFAPFDMLRADRTGRGDIWNKE